MQPQSWYRTGRNPSLKAPVDVQGRLALEGARRPYRPDLHRPVLAAASDEFTISTEADREDPVLERSQHVQDGGMLSSNTDLINSPVAVPGHMGSLYLDG